MSSYPTMHIQPDSDLSANSLESQASHVSETPGPEPCSVDPELEKGASIPEATLEAPGGPNRSLKRGRKEIKVTGTPTEGRGSKKRPLTSHIYLYGVKFQRSPILLEGEERQISPASDNGSGDPLSPCNVG
jgi:hypothetical protein